MMLSSIILAGSLMASAATAVNVQFPANAPENVSIVVDPSFPAFAFEEISFYRVGGPAGQPNVFARNLIETIGNLTNSRPVVRVGGTSLARSKYVADQTEALIIPPKQMNNWIPSNVKIGPNFFKAFNNIPSAVFVVDIPMGKRSKVATSVSFAKDAYTTIGKDNIISLELGNEPNSQGKNFVTQSYINDFTQFSTAISTAIGISPNDPVWQIGSLSTGSTWSPTGIVKGLAAAAPRVRSFSVHYYQFNSRKALDVAKYLMNHSAIVTKLSAFVPTITDFNSKNPTIPFNIAEAASGLSGLAKNTSYLERTFGAALWQVDFTLYAMTISVHRINFQSGLGFSFSQFQPVDFPIVPDPTIPFIPASVYANYYALPFAADFIGRCGAAQALNLDLNDPYMSAYAMYVNGTLARVALVNLNYWDGTASDAGARGSQSINVAVPAGVGSGSVTVRRLSSPLGAGGIEEEDIAYAGQRWSFASNGTAEAVTQENGVETVKVVNGVATVVVNDSEAVIVVIREITETCEMRNS